ncbi:MULTISPECIES: GntR family transcriptional regulator [Streptococcus]|uniref:GntR family transcriptional regulator n=1 Tax=Streptococcus caledonicus TaxID=2614158 RepID=A0ABW0UCM4_9STRE|nr:GntR family transcriptional regulator [Streptococcus sp. S784/96/1]
MFSLKKEKPLYLQLVDTLELDIRNSMSPNDKLLSERELTETYQVSRITVRQALQELEKRGLVYKMQGKGTYVSEIKEPAVDLGNVYSFTDEMKKLGKQPVTKTLSFSIVKATEHIARELKIELGAEVYELERLRLADDIPMMLERSYLPVIQFVGLNKEILSQKPLYQIVEEDYGERIRVAEEEFFASIALNHEAKLLEIKKGAPVLHLVRKTYNAKNKIIEFTFSIARADQFRYKVSHFRD